MKKILQQLLFSICFMAFTTAIQAQTTVTIDGSGTWNGYMNVFDLLNNYQFGSAWGLADVKSTVNTSTNTVTLQPNFNTYANAATAADTAYWHNGAIGNKNMEANTYLESLGLSGQTVTFNGTVLSNTLSSGYTQTAFVKVLDPNNGYATVLNQTVTLPSSGPFNVSAMVPATAGLLVQWGFTIFGLNANPVDETALGSVVVGPAIPLPLDKITFNTSYSNGAVNIKWETINESNLYEYEIQKSETPNNFETFTRQVANNETRNTYYVVDPFVTQATYYRLKVVDLDGSYNYSSIKKIEVPQVSQVGIYPNPTQEVIHIVGSESADINGAIIYNVNGTVINNLTTQNNEVELNISSFPVGVYWLKLKNGHVLNFLKQ